MPLTNTIIHVGFPKCASTFLQNKVFPYLDVHFNNAEKTIPFHCMEISLAESDKYLKKTDLNDTLVSYEGIVGDPYTGFTNYRDRVDLVFKHFPDAKIIVVIRSSGYLNSLWGQHVRQGGTKTKSEFQKMKMIPQEDVVRYLREKFQNVLVLDFAQLEKNPHQFVQDICTFLDVEMPAITDLTPAGVGFNTRKLVALRYVNMMRVFLRRKIDFDTRIRHRSPIGILHTLFFLLIEKVAKLVAGKQDVRSPFVSRNGHIEYRTANKLDILKQLASEPDSDAP